ncbi:MAG: hypothetical protein KDD89_00085 [Anaerolineales bacterium]|nr:hypothetical protein [Anaerolineales bacterium]
MYTINFPFISSPKPKPATRRAKRGLAGNPWSNHVPAKWHGNALGISCAQSWNTWQGTRDGVELLPMLWGHNRTLNGQTVNLYERFMRQVDNRYNGWVIMFNEPADGTQANMSYKDAAVIWADFAYTYPAAKLTSPQMLIGLDNDSGANFWYRAHDWLLRWFHELPVDLHGRVEAWAWHCYHSSADHAIKVNGDWSKMVDGLLPGKQKWVTEWGVNGLGKSDGGETDTRRVRAWMDHNTDRHFVFTNRVDAWSADWHGFNLVGDDGELTGVGRGWVK